MKKVIAFIGTATRRHTYRAVQEFEKALKEHEEIDFEYIFLSDFHLEICRGCRLCFDKGEENCPLKDDRDLLLNKIESADGVVFATPNYAFHVAARLKNFLDRTAYLNHRPRFFRQACTAVVTQGIFGGAKIANYLCLAGENLGMHSSKGFAANTLEPLTQGQIIKLAKKAKQAAARFHLELGRPMPRPSLLRLMGFRLSRHGFKTLDESAKDFNYFKAKGWFDSAYYYPVSLGPTKVILGALFDFIAWRIYKPRMPQRQVNNKT